TVCHLLGECVPQPARNVGPQVDFPQLWMTGRHQELVPVCKKPFGKASNASVSLASLWPIEHGKNCWYCNSLYLLSFCNKRRVVFRLELTHRVIVGKGLGVWNWNEVETGVRRVSRDEVKRISAYPAQHRQC